MSQQVFALSDNHPRRALSSEQVSGQIGIHMHDTSDICRGYVSTSLVLRQVSTQPLEFGHVSTVWLFHVFRETFQCVSDTNPVPSDMHQLITKLRHEVHSVGVSLSEFSICAVCSAFLQARVDAFCTNHFHALQGIFIKLRVSVQCHLVILYVVFFFFDSRSAFLRIFCRTPSAPSL